MRIVVSLSYTISLYSPRLIITGVTLLSVGDPIKNDIQRPTDIWGFVGSVVDILVWYDVCLTRALRSSRVVSTWVAYLVSPPWLASICDILTSTLP